jgi:uncharacterized protein Veg
MKRMKDEGGRMKAMLKGVRVISIHPSVLILHPSDRGFASWR